MTDTIKTTSYIDVKCPCDLRTRLVGDGCSVCNPALAAHYAENTNETQGHSHAEIIDVALDVVIEKNRVLHARLSTLEAAAENMAGALGQISRMRTRTDHQINTFTLMAAHELADAALQEYRKIKEGGE